jgi:voltage-gated potassium channel Kch
MQFDEILIGSAMLGLCVIIHVGAIVFLLGVMRRHAKAWMAWRFYPGATAIMLIIVVGLLLAHTLEIWLWAVLYIYLGEFSDMSRALYFSTVTFTTLGYGDVVLTDSWQLLSSLEAAGGILLFGLSTGASVAAMMAIIGAGDENNR